MFKNFDIKNFNENKDVYIYGIDEMATIIKNMYSSLDSEYKDIKSRIEKEKIKK